MFKRYLESRNLSIFDAIKIGFSEDKQKVIDFWKETPKGILKDMQRIYLTDKYNYVGNEKVKDYLKKGARIKVPEGFVINLKEEKDTYLKLMEIFSIKEQKNIDRD